MAQASKKTGKREVEEVIEKEVSKKKQKKDVEEVIIEKKVGKKKQKKDVAVAAVEKVEVKTGKKKIVKKQESSDDSSSSSESEEEQKVVSGKVAGAAKNCTMSAPKKKEESSEVSSSEEDSDSSDEDATAAKKAPAVVVAKNGTAKNKVKDDSDSEDDSSEDEVPEAKKVAAAKTKSGPVKMDLDVSSDDSDSEDSSSDDDAPPKKVPAAVAKKETVVATKKKVDTSEDSDSEDDSSEDDVPEAKKVAATITQNVPVKMDEDGSSDESESDDDASPKKVPAAVGKKAAVAVKKKEESSDDTDSDDDAPPKKAPAAVAKKATVAAKKKKEETSDDSNSHDEDSGVEAKANAGKSVPSSERKEAKTPITPKPQMLCSRTLYIHLSFNVEKAHVENFFKECGEVVDVRFATHPEGGLYVHVDFATVEEARKALKGINGDDRAGRMARLDLVVEGGRYTPHSKTPITPKLQTLCSRTLFIHLSSNVEKADVENFFKECGGEVVGVRFAKGGLKGYGHVEFATVEEARKAFNEINGHDLKSLFTRLDVAVEREAAYTPQSRDAASNQTSTGSQSCWTIRVEGFGKNLKENKIRGALKQHFSFCGEVTGIVVCVDEHRAPIGVAYIDFRTSDAVKSALGLDQSKLNEKPIRVEEAKPWVNSGGGHNDSGKKTTFGDD